MINLGGAWITCFTYSHVWLTLKMFLAKSKMVLSEYKTKILCGKKR